MCRDRDYWEVLSAFVSVSRILVSRAVANQTSVGMRIRAIQATGRNQSGVSGQGSAKKQFGGPVGVEIYKPTSPVSKTVRTKDAAVIKPRRT